MNNDHAKESGFTLIEIIVVLVLISILAIIAFPQVKDFLKNSTTRSTARDLYSQFQRTKTEAIKRNQNVSISFATASSPHQYRIFIDSNGNATLDAGETILETLTLPSLHNFDSVADGYGLGYDSRGRPLTGAGQVDLLNTDTLVKFRVASSVAGSITILKIP